MNTLIQSLEFRRLALSVALLGASVFASGCSILSNFPETEVSGSDPALTARQAAENYGSGSIVLARSVPAASPLLRSESLLAFSPVNINLDAPQSHVTISLSTLEATNTATTSRFKVRRIAENIKPGTYKVRLISEQPAWYATDSYYQNRGLAVPPSGSVQRYLKGALGKQAIYLEGSVPLHSAQEWSPEVGGIQIANEMFDMLAEKLEVNSLITFVP